MNSDKWQMMHLRNFYRYFLVLGFIIIGVNLDTNIVLPQEVNEGEIKQRARELHRLIQEKQSSDSIIMKLYRFITGKPSPVNRAIELDKIAAEKLNTGKKEEALRLLEEGIQLLTERTESKPTNELMTSKKLDPSSIKKRTVELSVGISKVYVTSVVPPYTSGEDVENKEYSTIFKPKALNTSNGKATLELSEIPIIIEGDTKRTPSLVTTGYADSPFGIHDITSHDLINLVDLGARWVRYAGKFGIVWGEVEPKRGEFSWPNDNIYLNTYNKNVNMIAEIFTVNRWDQSVKTGMPVPKLPTNLEAYKNFLRKAVERYDGDGIDDAPGSPVILYWLIENEPDIFWRDTKKNFAELMKISYKVIKDANDKAKVVMAGIGKPDGFHKFYIPMFKYLDKIKSKPEDRYFDIFEFHWWAGGTGGYRKITLEEYTTDFKQYVGSIRSLLNKYGYDVPIWITEMASHSGKPEEKKLRIYIPPETERQQAAELFKRYIYSLALGIKKIYWGTITEFHNFAGRGVNNYFDNVGLINNPRNDGESHKKLAYYTYKLMVEKLEGIDLDRIDTLNLGKDIFAFRFIKDGKKIYVLWSEAELQ